MKRSILHIIRRRGLLERAALCPSSLDSHLPKSAHSSFADVHEGHGKVIKGRNRGHSHDFKNILCARGGFDDLSHSICEENLTTFPKINRRCNGTAILLLKHGVRCLAQVDCQHRLGESGDSRLAFMTFIGLDLRRNGHVLLSSIRRQRDFRRLLQISIGVLRFPIL